MSRAEGERGHTLAALHEAFVARFGRRPERAARAPGRVNLIGEHTDYNDGLVLPCAIDLDTLALAAARDDDRVRVFSREHIALAWDVLGSRGWLGAHVR